MFTEFDEYLKELSKDKSEHTIRSYTKSIGDFIAFFNIQIIEDVKKLTGKDIRGYQEHLIESGLEHSSANARMRPISAFLHFLNDNDYIPDVLVDRVHHLKEIQKEPIFLTEEESSAIVNACKDLQTKTMIVLMLSTGLRRFEVTNAKVKDVEDGKILVHGKGNKEVYLPLNSKVKTLLERYLRKHDPADEYLFTSRKGGGQISEQTVYNRLKEACKKAGIAPERIDQITPHKLRHTVATNLLANGVDPITVQAVLRHNSFSTTLKYVHVQDKGKKNALETLAMNGLGD